MNIKTGKLTLNTKTRILADHFNLCFFCTWCEIAFWSNHFSVLASMSFFGYANTKTYSIWQFLEEHRWPYSYLQNLVLQYKIFAVAELRNWFYLNWLMIFETQFNWVFPVACNSNDFIEPMYICVLESSNSWQISISSRKVSNWILKYVRVSEILGVEIAKKAPYERKFYIYFPIGNSSGLYSMSLNYANPLSICRSCWRHCLLPPHYGGISSWRGRVPPQRLLRKEWRIPSAPRRWWMLAGAEQRFQRFWWCPWFWWYPWFWWCPKSGFLGMLYG